MGEKWEEVKKNLLLLLPLAFYWKQLENKQQMKASRFMKWNNCII
jgi:hypothetical protein